MAFTQIPEFPLRSQQNQDEFSALVEATFTSMPNFIDELNALGSILNTQITSTSTSLLIIGTGNQTLTVQTGLGFVEGYPIRIASRASPTNYMDGVVNSYNAITGQLVATIAVVQGLGTFMSWSVMILPAGGNFASLGSNKFTGQQVLPDEVTLTSSSTLDFTAGGSNQYLVTGTTTVTAVTMEIGAVVKVRFSGALVLTHGADLVLPALANYTTEAGDIASFTRSADGSVRVEIARVSGLPVTPPIIASQSEAEAGTDNTKYMSPLRVLNSIAKQFQSRSLTTNGYQIFPSGLIIQWGTTGTVPADTSVNVVFPINFPNACFSVVTNNQNAPASGTVLVSGARLFDKPNFLISNDSFAAVLNWIAIGY